MASKEKRARKGEVVSYENPDWAPLLDLARIYVDEFMWMFEVKLRDGTSLHAYKHVWTRRYLYLTADRRAFGWCGDERYEEIDVESVFDLVVGRRDPALGIPRYTSLHGEGDGLDAG
jgi:hypothetical protein